MSSSTTDIEEWLEENCSGEWTIMIENIDDSIDDYIRTLKVLFEKRSDKEMFRRNRI